METLANRNNNPGNIRSTQTGNFRAFPTPQEGYTALLNDLQGKITGNTKTGLSGNSTLEEFSSVYAPSSDNNNVGQYTANLANKLGIAPNSKLSELQSKMPQFADAIAQNEGYKAETEQIAPQPASNTTRDILLAGGAAGGSWLLNNAWNVLKPTKEKIAAGAGQGIAGAGIGAAGGSIIPGVGTAAGGTVGGITGFAKGYLQQGVSDIKGDAAKLQTGNQAQVVPQQPLAQLDMGQENIQQLDDTKNAVHALSETLQTTPTGKLLASMPQTQDSLAYMAQNGYMPNTESGVNDFGDSMKRNRELRSTLSKDIESILRETDEQGTLSEAKQNAYANIEKNADVREQDQQKAIIDKELEIYGKNGDTLSLADFEKYKREQGHAAGNWKLDTPVRNAHKALYGGLRDTITNNTKQKDLYNRVMKEEQKSFDADKLMKKMHGRRALEHRNIMRSTLKTYGKYAGTYLGDKIGGALGAIVGTMVSDHLIKSVDKSFGTTYFESKEGKKLLEIASQKSPEVARVLKEELGKFDLIIGENFTMKDIQKDKKEHFLEATGKKLEESKAIQEMKKGQFEQKRAGYKEKKKGMLEGPKISDEYTKNPYIPLDKLPTIPFGKPATPKKKKYVKGLPIIR